MAETRIANVIEPVLFAEYVLNRTTEKSLLVGSGIVTSSPQLNALVTAGGRTFNMPSWNDLSGNSEVISEGKDLTINNIDAGKEVATLLVRGKAWGASELSGIVAGSDPMQAIGNLVSDWWVRDEKKTLISILTGIFANTGMAGLKHTGAKINAELVFDAKQKLGDASDQLTAIFMHSATYTELQKQKVIDYLPTPDGSVTYPYYLGYRVIMDDSIPATDGTYKTYLFGAGVIGRGSGNPATLTAVETDRDSLASSDILINRKAMVLHPRGLSWVGTPADETPSNAELATGTNWKVEKDLKKIGIVELSHTL